MGKKPRRHGEKRVIYMDRGCGNGRGMMDNEPKPIGQDAHDG